MAFGLKFETFAEASAALLAAEKAYCNAESHLISVRRAYRDLEREWSKRWFDQPRGLSAGEGVDTPSRHITESVNPKDTSNV